MADREGPVARRARRAARSAPVMIGAVLFVLSALCFGWSVATLRAIDAYETWLEDH